jgi:hypothetical protein
MTFATWIVQASPRVANECDMLKLFWIPVGLIVVTQIFVMLTGIRARAHEKKVFAVSLAAELEGLFNRYRGTVGDVLSEAKQASDYHRGLKSPEFDFFIVFDSNTSKIGLLESQDAQDIVTIYVLLKSQFEDLITWAKLAPDDPWREVSFKLLKSNNAELKTRIPSLAQRLRNYSAGYKRSL